MAKVMETVAAVEGEAGDDGTIWTPDALQEIVRLCNQRQDARAWTETRPDGRLQVRIRVHPPGLADRLTRSDGRDAERLRAASEKRMRKAARNLRQGAGPVGEDPAPAPESTFRVRTADDL